MSDIVERLRAIDGYLNSLWYRAAKLRDLHTGQAHADLNDLRHGIGAIPDGLLEAAAAITTLRAENERMRGKLLQADALRKLIHTNLGEYIDAKGGTVDVTIALAFEATRDTP